MKQFLEIIILLLIVPVVMETSAAAQSKPAPKPAGDTSKLVLKLIPKLGPYGDSSKTLVSVAKQLLNNPLMVVDNKGGSYKVISFSIAWRKKEITDNYQTGTQKTIFTYNATKVYGADTIPAAWQQELKESLQAQEELFFDEILVQHIKTKKVAKSPSLRLLLL